VGRTSTLLAPWTLVEADDKNFARVKVLKTLCAMVETKLDELEKEGVDYLDKPKKRR
jgi:AMP-polyphosphate phosphotransferase